jgi:DnaJ-class molecular chaperone
MSVIDGPPPEDDRPDDTCPVCAGQGQVWVNGEPHFCLPCEGTGHVLAPDA